MSNENEINGTDVQAPAQPATAMPPGPERQIIQCQVELGPDQSWFELETHGPGIVRACTFWIQEPKVLAANMRGIPRRPHPLLFVEVDPAAEKVTRRYLFAPTGAAVSVRPGYEIHWRATAIMSSASGHLFEIVEAPS